MKYDRTQSGRAKVREPGEQLSLGFAPAPVSISELVTPAGYTGLSAFHKYWGKKPIECLGFLVEKLSHPGDLVVDPFVGSGLLARECAIRDRRFIGIDINPVSIELSRLISDLPSLDQYDKSLASLEREVRQSIDDSYRVSDGRTASHYVWDRSTLKEVWIAQKGGNAREVLSPTAFDCDLFAKHQGYTHRIIRPLRFFQNSRINTSAEMGLSDIFTGRALRNIELLLENIGKCLQSMRRALLLTLTASIGQMSNMVFAITSRGKTKGASSGKMEVGSWVIGYWRPPLHFEINVWNCFERRARKLAKALCDLGAPGSCLPAESVEAVVYGSERVALLNDDALHALKCLPKNSVSLVLTDPPHGDRIPYLELSELWNATLDRNADFGKEIVVSNARERGKTKATYNRQMADILVEVDRVLIPGGTLALFFNARDTDSWTSLSQKARCESLQYYGCFPMSYSANSVVQDNRAGAMRSDYVLIYRKASIGGRNGTVEKGIETLPGWSNDFPQKKGAENALHVSVS